MNFRIAKKQKKTHSSDTKVLSRISGEPYVFAIVFGPKKTETVIGGHDTIVRYFSKLPLSNAICIWYHNINGIKFKDKTFEVFGTHNKVEKVEIRLKRIRVPVIGNKPRTTMRYYSISVLLRDDAHSHHLGYFANMKEIARLRTLPSARLDILRLICTNNTYLDSAIKEYAKEPDHGSQLQRTRLR